ncbi:MAG: hypothetical protein HS116_18515 [Planctomycetes bacterium]|nr:hypothetical protein [Planctomycetota bacterium]
MSLFYAGQPVNVEGHGACIFECVGPMSDQCSVLSGPLGARTRHLVKLSQVQAGPAPAEGETDARPAKRRRP